MREIAAKRTNDGDPRWWVSTYTFNVHQQTVAVTASAGGFYALSNCWLFEAVIGGRLSA